MLSTTTAAAALVAFGSIGFALGLDAMGTVQPEQSALNGCHHVFLDIGSNVGVQITNVYEGKNSRMKPTFDRLFGPVADRAELVCSVVMEPNPHHADVLRGLKRRYAPARILVLNGTAASNRDGTQPFFILGSHPMYHEWGSSLLDRAGGSSADRGHVDIRTVDLARWTHREVLRRAPKPHSKRRSAALPPAVVMKLDVEGEEYNVLPNMLAHGVLCQLDAVFLEYHDASTRHRDIENRYKVPAAFQKTINYLVAHAGRCNVTIQTLGANEI